MVEAAIGIPVLLVVALTGIWCVSVGLASVSLAGAAGDAARALARGETWAAVSERTRAANPGIDLRVDRADDLVTVTAARDVMAGSGLLGGVGMTIERSATAPAEWATDVTGPDPAGQEGTP